MPPNLSSQEPRDTLATRFAEGNDYVFRALLGLSDGDIAQLYADGTTGSEPVGLVAIKVR
jgi:hypothetical protein